LLNYRQLHIYEHDISPCLNLFWIDTHCTILDTERVSPVDADMPPSEVCTRCCSWCHHRRIRVEILPDKSDIRTQHCRRSPRKLRPIDTAANRIVIHIWDCVCDAPLYIKKSYYCSSSCFLLFNLASRLFKVLKCRW